MITKTRNIIFSLMVAFIFMMSAIYVVPAYADDETPPVETPAATEPVEPLAQDPVTEEATPTPLESAPAIDEISPAPAGPVESILAEVPQGTDVVIVNGEGESLPLATQEAAEAIVTGDPIWCPAGVATPIANMNGCSGSYSTFAALLADPIFAAGGPAKDGVIWVEKTYAGADNAAITLNGATTLNVMSGFKLTVKGGWNGAGTGTVDLSTPSVFDVPLIITGWNNDITLSNITINGTASGTDALEVGTTKNITLTNVQSKNNTGRGANLHNDVGGTGNVTVTNSQFTNNTGVHGLLVSSNGIITLKDVTASLNANGYGAVLTNDGASTPKAVILSGTNTFSNNGTSSGFSGLYVSSLGAITVNNLIASNNGSAGFGQGAELYNNVGSSTGGVTLTGTSTFLDNVGTGLTINSFGAIKANNIFANSNGSMGASLSNSGAATAQAITLTGTNEFKYNTIFGLSAQSIGQITMNNVTANSNGQTGASLNNYLGSPLSTMGITLTGTNSFKLNGYTGLNIQSNGTVLLNSIGADGNGTSGFTGGGVGITNGSGSSQKNVTITGFNSFSDNYATGLYISSSGMVTLSNITANNNNTANFSQISYGVQIDNTSITLIPKSVTLNGINSFNNNELYGLSINSNGAITTNNITANNNGQGASFGSGVDLNNSNSSAGQIVAVKGVNTFNDNLDSGLYIQSKGAISTNAIITDGNDEYGVYLYNLGGSATSTVMMTGTNLITNSVLDNLIIQSASTVTLSNITASFSSTGKGANIVNTAGVAKAVTISGTNAFNSNFSVGLFVQSNGAITINNLTASSNTNGSNGARLDNTTSTIKAGVTLTGNNTFSGNLVGHGLLIRTLGAIKTNNITANSNGGYGVQIDANTVGAIGSVTMSGFNNFNGNTNINLNISSIGAVTVNGINSTGSTTADGASIDNAGGTKPVNLTGTNIFSGNATNGLVIFSSSVITTNNLTISNNGAFGGYLINSSAAIPAGINIFGTNLFDSNSIGGLYVESLGLIKTNNLTASNSANGFGADLNNNLVGSTAGVTMTGTNIFNNNNTKGLDVSSNGVITASNVNASFTTNGFGAAFDNLGSGFATPKAITLSGSNNFNSNRTSGLIIDTYGAVTINNLTASFNGLGLSTGIGADIDNFKLDSTIASSVNLTGNNIFLDNYQQGLLIDSFGAIKINNLTASLNGNPGGAILDNKSAPTNAFGITLTGKNIFDGNGGNGLEIDTKGAVIISAISATFNTISGADIANTYAGNLLPKAVTFTGLNVFSNNSESGLLITTNGVVTASSVKASDNLNGFGASIQNAAANTPANVIFTGFNVFNNNGLNGLLIGSKGAITLSNITANDNTFSGLDINNNTGTAGVTLTGINTFNNNGDNGATISSSGAVNITKITGDENGQSGLVVSTIGAITLTCGSFNLNTWYGWEVPNTSLLLTIKGVFTAGNGLGDSVNNALSTVPVRNCPLP